jgi:hypothetical protein
MHSGFFSLLILSLGFLTLIYIAIRAFYNTDNRSESRQQRSVPKRDDKDAANIAQAQKAGTFDIDSEKWEGSAIRVGMETSSNWSSRARTEYSDTNISISSRTSKTFYPSETTSKGELILRELVAEKFPDDYAEYNVRYKGIENPKTGARLEFDIYLPEKKIAFEFNGRQHYAPSGLYGNPEDQIFRDRAKALASAKAGILLITLTYRENTKEKQWAVISSILKNSGLAIN